MIILVEYVTHGVVLRKTWGQAMHALGNPTELPTGAIVVFNIWGFLLGIAAVRQLASLAGRFPGNHVGNRASSENEVTCSETN